MTLEYSLPQLLKALVDRNGSDLHITTNSPPRLRINGQLFSLDLSPLKSSHSKELCYSILNKNQIKAFQEGQELDLSFSIKGVSRFRANIFFQCGSVGGVFRRISEVVPTFGSLKLPSVLSQLCSLPQGLILVTGPTGSGKTTTVTALLDNINKNFHKHIITIEDPIEYMHVNELSIINQREVGSDTSSFSKALKSSFRQDPDVIFIGELRNFESMSLALTAAETGHLVFATVHTNSSIASINRFIDVFPPEQQDQVRAQLSFSLEAVISQRLIQSLDESRIACFEYLFVNSAIRNLIRENKIHQIYSAMQVGQSGSGMKTFNQALLELIKKKKISTKSAFNHTMNSNELHNMLQKAGFVLSVDP